MFKYCSNLSTFYNQHPSASSNDDGYIISADSSTIIGTPGILWENICFIESEKLIWTHGEFFCQKDDKGNAKIFHGTCSSEGSATAKIVDCAEFTSENLVTGALIFVTFAETNSGAVASLTMSVNSTTAKPIKKQGNASSTNNLANAGELRANSTYLFQYDGTNWVCMTLDYNSTYSALSEADMQTGTATTGRTITASRLKQAVEYWMTKNQADWNVTDNTLPSYILNKPEIPTAVTESIVTGWGFTKNTGTLTGITFNGVDASVTNGVAGITATIPPDNVFIIPVTKNGTSYTTTVTKTKAREALYAHKLLFVLYNNMVMPLRGYDSYDYGDYYFYAISNYYIYTMHLVAGSSDGPLNCNYSETALPSANNSTITIQKGGTNVDTFTTNAASNKTINIPNELPTYSSSDSGKILSVNSSGQLVWITPVNIYSGNDAPNNMQGNNGDIYIQTNS